MKQYSIIKVIKSEANSLGKSEDEFKNFENGYRKSINKKVGMFSKKELATFINKSKEWLNNATK